MATSPGRERRSPAFVLALIAVALATVAGCRTVPWVNPPPEQVDQTWRNARPTPDAYPDTDSATIAGLDAAFRHGQAPPVAPGRPLEVLVLSGGGKYGAFTAGVLVGWTANGTRPSFDVVTGISSGALTAVYAYVGPKYDCRLAGVYNDIRPTDLFRLQLIRGIRKRNGLATSEPLAQLIERELDAEMMADVRKAHHEGRRLFVATANQTTMRPVIWDVGAIATSGRRDADQLVRKILVASSSIPGWVEPIEFDVEVNGRRYRELHGDAGAIIQGFLCTSHGLPPGSNVYALTAGKNYRDALDERPGVVKELSATISNSLYAIFRDDMIKLYAHCALTGAQFHLAALPQDFRVTPGSLNFDTEEMRSLYRGGYQMGVNGIPWRNTPPGTQPGETILPRTGLQFVVGDVGPLPPPPPGR